MFAILFCLIVFVLFLFFFESSSESIENTSIAKKIKEDLSKLEVEIEEVRFISIFERVQYEQDQQDYFRTDLPSMATTEEQVKSLLSTEFLQGPHGLNLLNPSDIPSLPILSPELLNLDNDFYAARIKKAQKNLDQIRAKIDADIELAGRLKEAYSLNQQAAIEEIARLSLIRHAMPEIFQQEIHISYESDSRILLVVIIVPDLSSISIVKQKEIKYGYEWVGVSAKAQKKLKEDLLYSLCIRAGYLVAKSDANNNIDLVAINAKQSWFDPATGVPKEGVIASLQASKNDFLSLQIDRIEPKACFRHLKGISTPSIENATAIKPIFDLDMNDRRIVEGRNVSESLDPNANLAEMPWDDFEHLVRQLFEWEFAEEGMEVKVTCASRDRGVDAIMFDPNPLKGGKYVLQAKRYNRTVDVAAVRDLYGTVVNEGANRGILVTTSSYGPDTYEFAKDKPISLVDGQNLVRMLQKHGRNYHIRLEK